jgi:CRP-like cAMP-binding protein
MTTPNPTFKNRVLSSLPRSEIDGLVPHLKFLPLPQEQVLLDGDASYAYFLEDGIASAVITVASGNSVEVGVIGIDGVVGLPILLGTNHSPVRTFIQIAGSGYRIEAEALRVAFDRPGTLRRHLQKYIQAFMVQTTQTAACNRLHNIEERLARWLLSCHDRLGSDRLGLTQDFLGQMLGSPRTTVTLAVGLLQRAGMIDHARGVVTIRDRAALESAACECYQTVRDEYSRLGLL